jgi:thioredoxin 1
MNPTIEALARDFKVAKVNVDNNQELTRYLNISGFPTILIIKDGKVVSRHLGVTSEAVLRADMERWSAKTEVPV